MFNISKNIFKTFTDLLGPPLQSIGLYTPKDPTFGRYLLPPSHTYEISHSKLYKDVKISRRRLFINSNGLGIGKSQEIELKERELKENTHKNWVTFQTFEKINRLPNDVKADLLLIHGYGDYGGKWVANAYKFIERGFRVIAVDLPGHGRSSGLHVLVPSCNYLIQSVASVVKDVYPPNKKLFVMGHSLGGYVAISYALRYSPNIKNDEFNPSQRPKLSGVYALSPMLGISPETRPPWIVETVARALASLIGHIPLIKSDGTLKTDDKRIIEESLKDIRVYQGALRIGTGLALLSGVEDINRDVKKLNVPLRICHGDSDRVTLCSASQDFINRANNEKSDKSIKIMKNVNHVMLADKPTDISNEVVDDSIEWMMNQYRD